MARGISTNRQIGAIADCLHDEHIAFACRYYSSTTKQPQKRLTVTEAKQLAAAGVAIVAVYEDGPTEASYFSRARGERDAGHALQFGHAIGQPSGSAIYFAVDYDALTKHVEGVIAEYFAAIKAMWEGAAPGGSPYRIGVYGSGRVCAHIKDNLGIAKYAWLSESHGWAGHATYPKPDLRQEISSAALCKLAAGIGGHYEDNFASGDIGSFDRLDAPAGEVAPSISGAPLAVGGAIAPSPYAEALRELAMEEHRHHHLFTESDAPLRSRIRSYWEDIDMTFPGVKTAWSAVFVSWLMRTAGATPKEFKASSAHSRFVHRAIKNQRAGTGLFRAFPTRDYAPRVGDIIHNNRSNQSLTFAFAAEHEAYESHSAVVVERGSDTAGEFAVTIGGNESDTVGRRRVALDAGGFVIQRPVEPYICVIQNLK